MGRERGCIQFERNNLMLLRREEKKWGKMGNVSWKAKNSRDRFIINGLLGLGYLKNKGKTKTK